MRPLHAALACAAAVTLAAPAAARARGWQGVTPGSSTGPEVITKFGQPSTQGKLSGRTALVFKGEQAIPGTRQAQFLTRDDGVVAEIVVFPANQLDRETVEGTYGRPTQKAFTDDFRTVWLFKGSGITVFFGKDGYVEAISFKVPDARDRPEPAQARPLRAPAGHAGSTPPASE